MSRIAHLIAAKVCKDELVTSRMLGYSEQDGRFRAFQALEETIQRAIGPDPIELWPVSDATEQTE